MWLRALGIADTGGFHVTDQSQVRQASEWDLLLLKGGAWEGNAGGSSAGFDKVSSSVNSA